MNQFPQCFKLSPWALSAGWRRRSLAAGRSRLIALSTVLLGLLVWAISPACALATTWYPVAAASQGEQQQFVDLDSVKALSPGRVRVGSYYIDSRTGPPQRTDYVTEYDCDRRRFRDVEFNGPVGSRGWMPVDPDPLNSAAMEYVCAIAGSEQQQ
ncbi:hypothetical protein [Nodosilinea nodulosa]|uniref:hypothetical protein n=1 Tax=Nodosilinea nodulosa TaxID=416001 RepID=UPI000378084E|nr:hypothetical protein [Nodosilinea nodulosa]